MRPFVRCSGGGRVVLDERTLMGVLLVAGVSNACVLFASAAIAPRVAGLSLWALSSLVMAAGCFSFLTWTPGDRAFMPLVFNSSLVLAYFLWMLGTLRASNWNRGERLLWLGLVVLLLPIVVFTLHPDTALRVGFTTLARTIVRVGAIAALTRYAVHHRSLTAAVGACVLTLEATALLDRLVSTAFLGAVPQIGVGQGVTAFSFLTAMVLSTIVGAPLMMLLAFGRVVEELRSVALRDPLTSLANRRGFFERSEPALALSKRTRTPVAMLMLDIDHFKEVNDHHGHAAGDEVLQALGKVIAESVRESDVAARWGGEEFCVLLTGADEAGAVRSAERIRSRFSSTCSALACLCGEPTTVSIGVACRSTTSDLGQLQADADLALYRAKANGRDRTERLITNEKSTRSLRTS